MKSTSLAILAVSLASAAYAADKPSQDFIKTAIEGNFAEVEMGRLAQQKGHSESVKKFGQMLIDDHSAANQKAVDAAKAMGVAPPDRPSVKQKADYEKMSKMSGAQLIATIRSRRPDMPVILATGYAELPAGAEQDWQKLSKPFSEADLKQAIAKLFA